MSGVKIYTKTGDQGQTSLFSGHRVAKNSPYIEALGSVDECNSTIGASLSFLPTDSQFDKVREQLIHIQHSLFDLGAQLATPRTIAPPKKISKTRFDAEETLKLEKWIDEMEETLPPLKAFILPGGHQAGALLHMARCLCRKSERKIIPLVESGDVADAVLIYLNRLSDYLFVASRNINHLGSMPETKWCPHEYT